MTDTAIAKRQELALIKRDVVDVVANRVQQLIGEGQLQLPENYAVGNALMAWWLALQSCVDKDKRPALSVCTKDSIANATLDMVVQGLDPGKKQCYPVVYGKELVCQRSYFGDEALLRRARPEVAHVWAEPWYAGDDIEWEIKRGRRIVTKHIQKAENVGSLEKIRGGYVVVEDTDGNVLHCEIMTIEQIKKSWEKSKTYDGKRQTFHLEQPEEAVKRTVIRRASKRLINSSNDAYLVRAVERQEHLAAETEMRARVESEANKELLTFPVDTQPQEEEQAPARERAAEPAREPEVVEEEESPSSPTARFLDFIEANDLDASKARRLAAHMRGLGDARQLSNDHCAAILADPRPFLNRYTKEFGAPQKKNEQARLDGPGF